MLRSAATSLAMMFVLSAAPALAGPFDSTLLPPAPVGGPDGFVLAQTDGTIGDLVARVQRLEGQNRQLTGQVQELQNQLRRAQDDFNRYREDTEFRLQAVEGGKGPAPRPQKKVEAAPPPPQQQQAGLGVPPQTLGTIPVNPGPPALDDGGQPGPDDQQVMADPNAPMTLPGGGYPADGQPRSSLTPPGLPGVAVNTAAPPPLSQQAALSPQAPGPRSAEDEYSADYRLIESGNYEAAEAAFRKFLAAYPKDKRVPDAIHWVGESLFQRKQYRDAAEQFLTVTKNYSGYRRAPSSMYRLGMSLAALGEKEAACATFQEIGRKYPNAAATVKSGVQRETQRNGC